MQPLKKHGIQTSCQTAQNLLNGVIDFIQIRFQDRDIFIRVLIIIENFHPEIPAYFVLTVLQQVHEIPVSVGNGGVAEINNSGEGIILDNHMFTAQIIMAQGADISNDSRVREYICKQIIQI